MPSSAPTGFLRLTEEVLGAKKLDYSTHLNNLESFTVGTMRNLILVALILQAVLTVDTNGFEFGDIISFKPRCGPFGSSYMHFAVYVGDKNFTGKEEGDNIFERLRVPPKCPFSQLNFTEEPLVANYLDGYTDKTGKEYKKGSDEEITIRINKKYKKCGMYEVLGNNCEHLATYVRYGVKVALQFNLTGEGLCINNWRVKTKDMVKYVRDSTTCETNPTSD